jgi:protein MpaA
VTAAGRSTWVHGPVKVFASPNKPHTKNRETMRTESMRTGVYKFDRMKRWGACLLVTFTSLTCAVPMHTSTKDSPCRDWVKRVPGLSQQACTATALQASGHRSAKGQPIWFSDIGPHEEASHALRVLVLGGIHGDELTASTLALNWLGLASTSREPASQQTLWRFVPLVNPDGLLSTPPRRTNAHGVDLNRNFPTPHWDREARRYWQSKTRKDPRRYPGPSAMSEPEAKYVHQLIHDWKPQLIVSIHAPYGVLDFDSSPDQPTPPPNKLGKLYLQQVGVYPGSLGNYAGLHLGIPVVTVELPSAHRAPTSQETQQMWADLLRWMGNQWKAHTPQKTETP